MEIGSERGILERSPREGDPKSLCKTAQSSGCSSDMLALVPSMSKKKEKSNSLAKLQELPEISAVIHCLCVGGRG